MTESYLKLNKVRIGYHTYRIDFVNGLEDKGSADLDTKVIQINPAYPIPVIRDTLLHEILHVLLYESALSSCNTMDPEKLEEHLVLLLAPSLLLMFQENPEVKDFLLSHE